MDLSNTERTTELSNYCNFRLTRLSIPLSLWRLELYYKEYCTQEQSSMIKFFIYLQFFDMEGMENINSEIIRSKLRLIKYFVKSPGHKYFKGRLNCFKNHKSPFVIKGITISIFNALSLRFWLDIYFVEDNHHFFSELIVLYLEVYWILIVCLCTLWNYNAQRQTHGVGL